MPSYQMAFETFLDEVKRWKINTNSMFRVKMEDSGDTYIFCLNIPNTTEEYVCVVRKEEVTEVQMMDLIPVIIKAKRVSESMKAAQAISNKIQEVEDAKKLQPIKR